MGVKTTLSLTEANTLFPSFKFIKIKPSTDGIIDTTYSVYGTKQSYILKKFEEATPLQINRQHDLLKQLQASHLSVPDLLASASPWYLYTKLPGETPSTLTYLQTQNLAKAMATIHISTRHQKRGQPLFDPLKIKQELCQLKKSAFYHYKKLSYLQNIKLEHHGIIHGDIFLDNLLFNGHSVGLIDFIDADDGNFSFDLGVCAMACIETLPKLQVLRRCYNRTSPQKTTLTSLLEMMQTGADFYTLKRLLSQQSTHSQQALQKKIRRLKRVRS